MAEANVTRKITLTLTELEAQVLKVILLRTGGTASASYERESLDIFNALDSAGVEDNEYVNEQLTGGLLAFRDGRPYEVS